MVGCSRGAKAEEGLGARASPASSGSGAGRSPSGVDGRPEEGA